MAAIHLASRSPKQSGTTPTFTTTDTYVDVLTIEDLAGAYIKVVNLSSSKAMLYKITGYLSHDDNCTADTVLAETSLAASASIKLPTASVATNLNTPFSKLVVSVKQDDGTGDGQIDWLAY